MLVRPVAGSSAAEPYRTTQQTFIGFSVSRTDLLRPATTGLDLSDRFLDSRFVGLSNRFAAAEQDWTGFLRNVHEFPENPK
jgi:hypothetical protein